MSTSHPGQAKGSKIWIGSIVIRVDDLVRMTEFWSAALNYIPREDPHTSDSVLLRPKDGIGPNVNLDHVRSALQIPPRIHLDLYTNGPEEQAAEVKRLIALGATEIHWDRKPPDADFIILADPEGNRFCIIE